MPKSWYWSEAATDRSWCENLSRSPATTCFRFATMTKWRMWWSDGRWAAKRFPKTKPSRVIFGQWNAIERFNDVLRHSWVRGCRKNIPSWYRGSLMEISHRSKEVVMSHWALVRSSKRTILGISISRRCRLIDENRRLMIHWLDSPWDSLHCVMSILEMWGDNGLSLTWSCQDSIWEWISKLYLHIKLV